MQASTIHGLIIILVAVALFWAAKKSQRKSWEDYKNGGQAWVFLSAAAACGILSGIAALVGGIITLITGKPLF